MRSWGDRDESPEIGLIPRQASSRRGEGDARWSWLALYRSVNTTLTFYSMERGSGGGGSLELAGGGGGGGGNTDLCLQDLVTGSTAGLSVQHHQHSAAAASMAGLHGDHLQGAMHHHELHGNSHHDASMLHNSNHQLHEPLEKLKRGESVTIWERGVGFSRHFSLVSNSLLAKFLLLLLLLRTIFLGEKGRETREMRKVAYTWFRLELREWNKMKDYPGFSCSRARRMKYPMYLLDAMFNKGNDYISAASVSLYSSCL